VEVSGQLNPRKKTWSPLNRRLCGPGADLDVEGNKNFCSYWEWSYGLPARSLVTILTELSRFGVNLFNGNLKPIKNIVCKIFRIV
jgi:hypothetical protein